MRLLVFPRVIQRKSDKALFAGRAGYQNEFDRRVTGVTFIDVRPVRHIRGPLWLATGPWARENIADFEMRSAP
jgi:hypothetical protein